MVQKVSKPHPQHNPLLRQSSVYPVCYSYIFAKNVDKYAAFISVYIHNPEAQSLIAL